MKSKKEIKEEIRKLKNSSYDEATYGDWMAALAWVLEEGKGKSSKAEEPRCWICGKTEEEMSDENEIRLDVERGLSSHPICEDCYVTLRGIAYDSMQDHLLLMLQDFEEGERIKSYLFEEFAHRTSEALKE